MVVVQDERFLSLKEVAEMFDKKESTIRPWVTEGRLDRVKTGGSTLIPESAIAKMLAQ